MSRFCGSWAARRPAVVAVASALAVVLLLVPALARAGQRLSRGPARAADAQRFHKSIDLPPDPPQPADTAVASFVAAALERCGSRSVVEETALPPALDIFDADSLRAPPALAGACHQV